MYVPDLQIAAAAQVNTSAPRSTGQPLARFLFAFAETYRAVERERIIGNW